MPTTLMLLFLQLLSQINSDLKYIDRWLKANKLSLNVAKAESMIIRLEAEIRVLK